MGPAPGRVPASVAGLKRRQGGLAIGGNDGGGILDLGEIDAREFNRFTSPSSTTTGTLTASSVVAASGGNSEAMGGAATTRSE